jgi:uroporphyrin-III C-methyltransferase/precorrin-2 dehydrogenase/sirohydrochlorin ferrochelatase
MMNRERGIFDQAKGSVSLVGAGPGDPDLLTIAALRAIESADVIMFDELVSQEVLALANKTALMIHVGKRGYRPSCKQSDINQEIVRWALEGRKVVRLKSGDPSIFGRAGEEIEACAAAGIDVEIIPGVTSAQGAAARLRVSLTHRDHARRIQFITGHDRHGSVPVDLNWEAIADPNATTIVYMPLRTLRELTAKAMALGLPADTPAVAIANVTRSDERAVSSTVGKIADDLECDPPGSPLLILIGKVFGDARQIQSLREIALANA